MATRLLLTLLALMAGLAAQFTPAQARAGVLSDTEIGAVASVAPLKRHVASALPARGCTEIRALGRVERVRPLSCPPVLAITTVRQGIDRARE
jgi:hypothetical protein